jgi:hypothetical protein
MQFFVRSRICWLIVALAWCTAAQAAICPAGASSPACAPSANHSPPHFRQGASPVADRQLLGPYEVLMGLLLIGGVAYWWRRKHGLPRLAGDSAGSELQVVSQRRLSARTTLYVVRHRDREVVLAEHESGISTIREFSES